MNNPLRHIAVFLGATTIVLTMAASPAAAGEVMTDRCSAEVAIVSSYDARPDSPGTVVLKRTSSGSTDWTPTLKVKLSGGGSIRWWCHSTTGNAFDPGTWRIQELFVETKCEIFADGTPARCHPDANIELGSSAWSGWTPESSRCNNRSTKIRARLDRDRLLQIECLGR